jgi:hypothetical protein
MKLPNAERAVVEIEKIRDYCLSTSHSRGRHKARVFAAALGLTSEDADVLRSALLNAAKTGEAQPAEEDEYGKRFTVDFSMKHYGNEAVVRSSWIIRIGDDFPRLTSCYVL